MSSHHAYDYQAYLTSSCIRVTQGGITSSQVRSTVECPGKIEKSQAAHNIKSKLVCTLPLFWKRVTICTFHNVSQLTPVLNHGNVQDRLGATSTHIHFQCHAASTSSTTRVVTVGIASGRGEGRGRERGKGEGGRKWVIAVAGITVSACITQCFYTLHWNSCSHKRHWFWYTYLIGYTKVSMGIDEKLDYRVMSKKTRTMECSIPIL